jgi:YfhD-like protein
LNNDQNDISIAFGEDVEFSEELADQEDKEAQERAAAADRRINAADERE